MALLDPSADPSRVAGAHPAPSPHRLRGVSVVAVVRDEEAHLRAALASALDQDYDGALEVVVAVGPSRDRTLELARSMAADDERLVVLENPTGARSTGLNLALAHVHAAHDVVVRIDGHSELTPDYVRKVVGLLQHTGAVNVGGMMVPLGRTPVQRAIARAMSHPAGIGSAAFHTGGPAGPVDTVYLGAFRRSALTAVGGYDESLVRAEDWELNARLRARGGTVWFDPSLRVVYYPRSSFADLARQFWRTGMWRRAVVSRDPRTVGLRYLAPPALVLALAASLALLVGGPWVVGTWALAGLVVPGLYTASVLAASAHAGSREPLLVRVYLPAVMVTMHVAWGAGFLRGVTRHAATEHRT